MEIVFIGTGGGRFNLIAQERGTGGFRINGGINIHVDPGPGALLRGNELGQDARNLDYVIVTHDHIDHVNDAALLLEAMSDYSRGRGGGLVSSKSVLVVYVWVS